MEALPGTFYLYLVVKVALALLPIGTSFHKTGTVQCQNIDGQENNNKKNLDPFVLRRERCSLRYKANAGRLCSQLYSSWGHFQ